MASLIISTMSFAVLISNVVFLVLLALFIFSLPTRNWITEHISNNVAIYFLIFSLSAVLGSMALSDIIGFPPCELCWFQRIAMYPQVLISFVALLRKEKVFIYYCLPLSVVGLVISLYQSYIQWGGTNSVLSCTLSGGECGKLYVYAYNYITIPFMALSVFVYLIAIALIYVFNKSR